MKKRVLILTERFYPEEFLINDLAAEWQKQGFQVEVLTQAPSYPHDKIFPGYKNKLYQTTVELNGIPVHRVRTVLGYNSSVAKKILNYISFAFLTCIFALFSGWKYHRVFTFHSGPLTMASAGVIFRFIWWKKCMIWTQDVWPDTVYNYGVKPSLWMRIFLNIIIKTIYSGYTAISASCPGFISKMSLYTKKEVVCFPQWTTLSQILPEKAKSSPVIFTFAGNIGTVQNLHNVIRLFGDLQRDDMLLRIVGGGINLEPLKSFVLEQNYKNVIFTGRLPQNEMPEQFKLSDVLVISLKPEFDLTIPAKFQAYIASGRPILGLVRGDTAALIERYNVGVAADPSDGNAITEAFLKMANATDDQFAQWRKNALELSNNEFSREKIINAMTEKLIATKA